MFFFFMKMCYYQHDKICDKSFLCETNKLREPRLFHDWQLSSSRHWQKSRIVVFCRIVNSWPLWNAACFRLHRQNWLQECVLREMQSCQEPDLLEIFCHVQRRQHPTPFKKQVTYAAICNDVMWLEVWTTNRSKQSYKKMFSGSGKLPAFRTCWKRAVVTRLMFVLRLSSL